MDLGHLVKVGLPSYSTVKLLLFSFFLFHLLWKQMTKSSPHSRKYKEGCRGLFYLLASRISKLFYLEFFCGKNLFLLPIYLFMQSSFISVWIHAYLVCTLDYNLMPHYLFCCSNCFNFDH